jgi:hypothetical protein
MAGPQDYLTVKGPEGASYSLPKFDLGSQIASLPTSYQEGQQYGVKRALQTAFKDGFPTDQQGNPDYNAMATRLLAIGGPEAAQPYFQMGLQQGNAAGNQAVLGGQPAPQGGQGNPPQTFTPMAPNAATGPSGITGEHPSTGGGSIFPYKPGTSPPQIMSGGPQGGAGLGGQPAPFAGNRDQQGAPPGPVGGGTITQDGTTGQPAAPTSSRETANNGQQDRRIVAADRLDAQAAIIQQQALRYGQSPAAVKTLQDRAQQLTDQAKQYREAALKDTEATPEQKNLTSGATQKSKELEGDIARSQKTYGGMHAISNQFETGLEPAIQVAKGILNRPEMYSGIGGQFSLDFNKVRAALGDRGAATLQEGLQKINAISVLAQVNQQKDEMQETGATSSRIFSQQVDQVAKASASMENTVNGNRFLINFQDRMGQFSKALTAQAQAYIQAHGHLDVGFDKQVSNYIAKNPIFSPQERADPRILGAPDAPPGHQTKAQVMGWAKSMGLSSGDPFRTPAGDVRYIP